MRQSADGRGERKTTFFACSDLQCASSELLPLKCSEAAGACFLIVFILKGKTTDAILCKQCAMMKNLKEDPVKDKKSYFWL